MYNYREIENSLGPRDHYPNAASAAHFDAQSQTIHLTSMTEAVFLAAARDHDYSALRGYLGTMLHEQTHWADLVGTVWGRKYIRDVYRALNLLNDIDTEGAENKFFEFVDLHDDTRRLMLGKYFRTVHPNPAPHDHRRRWGIQFSAGREFDPTGRPDDTRPIIFVKFLDNPSGKQIARQPISVGALLEINAVWSEIKTNIEIIYAIEEPARSVEMAMFTRERIRYLYDPDFTLYTAAAHLLAHHTKISDVVLAYQVASAVAHVALNLQNEHFEALVPPASMTVWQNLFAGFKSSRNRGFAYSVICASGKAWVEGQTVLGWLDDALSSAGLPASNTIYEAAKAEMTAGAIENEDSVLGKAERYLMDLGKEAFAIRSQGDAALTPSVLTNSQLPTPPMFDYDGVQISLTPGKFDMSRFDPETLHGISASLHTWTQRFLGACR